MEDLPLLVTSSPYYNFLREAWLENKDSKKAAHKVIQEASEAWILLPSNEKELFEEELYMSARKTLNRCEFQESLAPKLISKKPRVMNERPNQHLSFTKVAIMSISIFLLLAYFFY